MMALAFVAAVSIPSASASESSLCDQALINSATSSLKSRTFSILKHLSDFQVLAQVPETYRASDLEWRIRFFISQADAPQSALRQITWAEGWEYLHFYTTPIWEMALADDSPLAAEIKNEALVHFQNLVESLLRPLVNPQGLAEAGRWRSRFKYGSRIRQVYEKLLLARYLKLQDGWWEVKQLSDNLMVELADIPDRQQKIKRIQEVIRIAEHYPGRPDQLARLQRLIEILL